MSLPSYFHTPFVFFSLYFLINDPPFFLRFSDATLEDRRSTALCPADITFARACVFPHSGPRLFFPSPGADPPPFSFCSLLLFREIDLSRSPRSSIHIDTYWPLPSFGYCPLRKQASWSRPPDFPWCCHFPPLSVRPFLFPPHGRA